MAAIGKHIDCSDLNIRWKNREDDRRTAEIQEMDYRAFESGHQHLLGADEMQLLRDNPAHGEVWGFDWSPLPPHRLDLYAFDGDRVIGHLAIHMSNDEHDRYAVIEPMNVDPEYQGRGVGSCLWAYTAVHAQTMGTRIKGLQVWAMEGNQQAIGFYRSRPDVAEVGAGNWWIGRSQKHMFPATGFEVNFKPQSGPIDSSSSTSSLNPALSTHPLRDRAGKSLPATTT